MLDPPGLLGVPTKSQVPRQARGWGYLSSPQLLIPAAQHPLRTPSSISWSAPGFQKLRELSTPDATEATGSTTEGCLQLSSKGNGQERRTLSRPCGFPAPGGRLLQWLRRRMCEMAPGAPEAGQGLGSGRDRGDGGTGSSPL